MILNENAPLHSLAAYNRDTAQQAVTQKNASCWRQEGRWRRLAALRTRQANYYRRHRRRRCSCCRRLCRTRIRPPATATLSLSIDVPKILTTPGARLQQRNTVPITSSIDVGRVNGTILTQLNNVNSFKNRRSTGATSEVGLLSMRVLRRKSETCVTLQFYCNKH